MSPLNFSLRRPVTVVVLVLALCLGGLLGLRRMARDVFPPLGIPTLYVAQPFGGMDPAQMEGSLTYYYEYHFLYITGIEHVESKNIQGAAIMKLQFHPGTDMAAALAETVAYVNRARAFMPAGTPGPFVTRFDAGSVPVGQLVFSTENPARTVGQMQDAALNQVRPLFATLPGVSAPPPFGGSARTITVNVKPDRMRAYGLSPDEVVQAVAQANIVSPSGNLNLGDKYPLVPANAQVRNIRDLEGVPIRVQGGAGVFVRDVATVADGADLVTSHALVNGRRTVYMPVTKRADASTLEVVDLVKRNLPKFQAAVAEDIRVSYELDQSPVVTRAIGDLVKEGALGALLTGLMVLVFLRDLRSALVVVANIPLALLASAFALWVSGQTVNLMTLGGLALAVGILVDEATVSVENLHVHLARGESLAQAALKATRETAMPRLLAMLCIVAVFIPAFFMEGAARALFTPLALAVGFAMAASFVLSSTLVPILAVWFLGSAGHVAEPGWLSVLQRRYTCVMQTVLKARWAVVGVYLVATLGTVLVLGSRLGLEVFPSVESGQFAFRLRAAPGTRLDVTEQIALKALETVHREAGTNAIALTLGLVGVHAPNYPVNLIHLWNSGPDEAHLSVQMRTGSGVRIPELKERLRAAFASELPDVRVSFEPSDIVSRVMSFGSPTPIEVAVSGPNLAASREHAERLLVKLRSLPGLRDVQIAQSLDFPSVDVTVDRERAGLMGVKVGDVARSLVAATTSSRFTVPNYWADPASGVSYSVQVQVPQSETRSLEDVRNLPVGSGSQRGVLLRNVASVESGTTVGQYERYNMARVVGITANLGGWDLGRALRELESIPEIADPKTWPARTRVDVRGQAVPLRQLVGGFRSGLGVAVAVVFLMLLANFQSARLALAVVSTVPAVLCGVVFMLLLTRTSLNLQSAIGAIMAVGVAVANAILLVTFAEKARQEGASPVEAALAGAVSRLRPILMTSAAMVAGMVPMALGLGEGGPQTGPLGRAVAGGLLVVTVATLGVLPAVFALLAPKAVRSASLDPEDPESPHFTKGESR
jgi:multidrug efflux pump subunit AcrB